MNASDQITKRINELADWRGRVVARLRQLIRDAAPELVEDWKWDTPVWSHNGNVVSVGTFQDHVKLNFFKGAALADPHHLFNAGLDAKTSRGIDIHANDKINEPALQALVRAAALEDKPKTSKATAPRAKLKPSRKATKVGRKG